MVKDVSVISIFVKNTDVVPITKAPCLRHLSFVLPQMEVCADVNFGKLKLAAIDSWLINRAMNIHAARWRILLRLISYFLNREVQK